MANKNVKWTQDMRRTLYGRLASEFGPYAGWGKSSYPVGRKAEFEKALRDLAEYFRWHDGETFKPAAIHLQMRWAVTRQRTVENAGFAYQYILNTAAALETGFVSSKELRGFVHIGDNPISVNEDRSIGADDVEIRTSSE